MTRISRFLPEYLEEDQRELYNTIVNGSRASEPQHFPLVAPDKTLNGPFNAFLLSPPIGDSLQRLGATIRFKSSIPDRMREIAILLVAARWKCTFERDSHEAVGAAAGLSDTEIQALRAQDPSLFVGIERLAAQVVLALLDGDLGDHDWEAASSELGEGVVFELTTLVGYYSTLALQLRVFRV